MPGAVLLDHGDVLARHEAAAIGRTDAHEAPFRPNANTLSAGIAVWSTCRTACGDERYCA
jgi:hypothetical protein